MSDTRYENFRLLTDLCTMPCAVLSVKKGAENAPADIRVIASNSLFQRETEVSEGRLSSEKISTDPLFEDAACSAAFNSTHHHFFTDTTSLFGLWTENILLPLSHDGKEDMGYCQYICNFVKEMDAGKYSVISPDVASFVIRTCLNLRKGEDFYASMDIVTRDIREFTDSFAASILTLSRDVDKFEVVSASVRNNALDLHEVFSNIPYEIVESWEWLISETDCIIIRNDEDLKTIEGKAPLWVKSLKENDVHSLCLVPFIHQNTVIGYLYITNFDVSHLARVKDTIELVSFFLSTETAHHLFVDKLKTLSTIDARTGVLNRNAMNNKVDELSVQLRYDPKPFSVAFCYLNTLKTVNARQGHDAGNNLLREAGRLMKDVFKNDFIYRSSGDEFAVISTDSTEEEFEEKIERLRELASDPEWIYFTVGHYTDSSDGQLHSAMHFATEYEREFKEEFYYNYPDMVK